MFIFVFSYIDMLNYTEPRQMHSVDMHMLEFTCVCVL